MDDLSILREPVYVKKYDHIISKRRKLSEKCVVLHDERIKNRIETLTLLNVQVEQFRQSLKDTLKQKDNGDVEVHLLKEKIVMMEEEKKGLEMKILKLRKEKSVKDEEFRVLLERKKQAQAEKEASQAELILTNEAFLKAIAHYKSKLQIRLRACREDHTVLLEFLRCPTQDGGVCTVTLSNAAGTWKLLRLEPDLLCRKQLAERLEKTQDTRGFTAHVRKLFIQELSRNKKCAKQK